MKRFNKIYGSRKRLGFTLVEIFVVAVLIALFAGLAIFGVQQMFKDNLRKACIGEVRQIATAMSFARQDLDFFPRICYLDLSYNSLLDTVTNLNHVHTMGFESNQLASRVQMDWNGPYFSASLARNRVSQGRGGMVKMINTDTTPGPGATGNPPIMDWPADPWGNPYVMYVVKNVSQGNTMVPSFITEAWEDGDKFTAIVSYGLNKYPGGAPEDPATQAHLDARLYIPYTQARTFINLTTNQYFLNNRAAAISKRYYPGATPADIWILDDGSDDIMYEF